MRVVVTGASGRIGRRLVAALDSDHEVRPLDRYRMPGRLRPKTDLRKTYAMLAAVPGPYWLTPWWPRAFRGAEAVVHLAADPDPDAGREALWRNNFQVTWNVARAAVRRGVPRMVFASSTWAVRAALESIEPRCYEPEGPKLDSGLPPSPTTPYGATKAFGEELGRRLVESGLMEAFVAVRIGLFRETPPEAPHLRARWVSPSDVVRLLRRAVEVDLSGFHVVYAASRQETSPFDLDRTRTLLGWEPREHPDDDRYGTGGAPQTGAPAAVTEAPGTTP